MWAALTAGRNCVGYEIEEGLRNEIYAIADSIVGYANQRIGRRIRAHVDYVKQNQCHPGRFKYINQHYGFPVRTRQEIDIFINMLTTIQNTTGNGFEVVYSIEKTPSL
jgi:hypothetical protein